MSKSKEIFNAYDRIRELESIQKERLLTQEEWEDLFYCKNATAEQDYFGQLD